MIFGIRFCFTLSIFVMLITEAHGLERLYRVWAASPVHPQLRHADEGIERDGPSLIIRTRYEDYSVIQAKEPTRELTCRFLHSFLYGRHRVRSSGVKLIPQIAFDRHSDVEKLNYQFFAIFLTNEATPPSWDTTPSTPPQAIDPEAKLRVHWKLQEILVPYLQVEVSRAEWATLASVLEPRPLYSFSDFYKEACDSVFRMLPQVRSNFQAIHNALSQKK